jgi:hypothetical protein
MRGLGFKIEAGRSDPHLRAIRERRLVYDQDGDPFEALDVQGVVKHFAPDARKVVRSGDSRRFCLFGIEDPVTVSTLRVIARNAFTVLAFRRCFQSGRAGDISGRSRSNECGGSASR